MEEQLVRREECAKELRETIGEDAFLLRFALLYAVECLDLRHINRLVEAVITTRENPDYERLRRVAQLEEERLRPSRLS